MKKIFITFLICMIISFMQVNNGFSQIVISGFLANPGGTDGNYEYVQLMATENIDFSITPYSVIWLNNGTATVKGWVAGGNLSYGFNLTSGTVSRGEVFYVGGDMKLIYGSGSTDISSLKWVRTKLTATEAGDDGLGTASSSGNLGNGGTNADGIGVFAGLISSLDSSIIPVDAVFYGTAVGSAKPATGGYTVPNNDHYATSQGTFGNGTNTYLFPDVSSGAYIKMSGSYNVATKSWHIPRTGTPVTLTVTSTASVLDPALSLVPQVEFGSIPYSGSNIKQGDSNIQLYKVFLKVTGQDISIDSLLFNIQGTATMSDIKQFNLWHSSDSIWDLSDSLLATVNVFSSGALMFNNINFNFTASNIHCLFLTLDLKSSAVLGNNIYVGSMPLSNIYTPDYIKTGSNPLPASGIMTIVSPYAPSFSAQYTQNIGNVIYHTPHFHYFILSGNNLDPLADTIYILSGALTEISLDNGSGYIFGTIGIPYSGGSLMDTVFLSTEPVKFGQFFDSIYVYGGNAPLMKVPFSGNCISADTIAPTVKTAYATSLINVVVVFNEAVDTSAEIKSNYKGLGTLNTVVRRAGLDTVDIVLTTALSMGIPKTLSISGISDTCFNHNVMKNAQQFQIIFGSLPQPPSYNISQVTTEDASGVADSLNVYCKLNGIVQCGDLKTVTSSQKNFFIHDGTGGINVFKSTNVTPPYTPRMGDSVRVIGKIVQYAGLIEIQIDSLVVLDSLKSARIPKVVTKLNESTEAEVIMIKNLVLVKASEWPSTAGGNVNVNVTNGIDTFVMRVFGTVDIQGTPAPTGIFDLSGIGAQYDNSSPFTSGYQIFPRCLCDVHKHAQPPSSIVINEIMADASGSDAWIELYNPNSLEVKLLGYTLSNDSSNLSKWAFPDTLIKGNGYLIVWDSNHSGLHTNFTLNKTGGELVLSKSGPAMLDYLKYALQKKDTSYARVPNAMGSFKYAKPTPAAANKLFPSVYTIKQVRGVDASGVADSLGVECVLEGVVHGFNMRTTGYQFWMHDGTAGINVFKYTNLTPHYVVREGDKIRVTGVIEQYRGLTEINPSEIALIDSGQSTQTPIVVTTLDESSESEIVTIQNLTIMDTTNATAGYTIRVTNGTDIFEVRIDDLCDLYQADYIDTVFDLTGIGGQYDATSPYLEGYQIMPRYKADVRLHNSSISENGIAELLIYPNPNKGIFIIQTAHNEFLQITIYDIAGRTIYQGQINGGMKSISLTSGSEGLYLVKTVDLRSGRISFSKILVR